MLIRFDAGDNRSNFSSRIDHERGALNAHILAAVKTFFLEHAKLVRDALVFIGQERIGQIEFLFEFLLCGRLVPGDAQHYCAGSLDFLECVAEPARFQRSTGRVRLRIEEQDQVLAAKICERDFLAIFIGKRELGRFIINLHTVFVLKSPMNLYRRRTFPASLALLLAFIFALTTFTFAQRRKPHKLRATGLLTLTTDPTGTTTARLTPITILDQGRFEDASIYKARPEPMALDKGVVYEAQKSGVPVGYVTILNASNQGIWTALGKWQPVTEEAKKSGQPAHPAGSGSSGDDRPILHRGENSSAEPASTPPPVAAQATPTPEPQQEEPEDPDRPVLRRRSPASSPTPQPAPAASTPTPAPQGAVPSTPAPVAKSGTQTFVAVSDAEPSDTRSYEWKWKSGDEQQAEAKMRKLALAQLPRENAQLSESSMQNVVIRAFDLDLSNDAVLVLTAEVPGSYVTPGHKGAPGKFVSRYITLIAKQNFEGDLERLSASVTDSSRLDVAPRLELIDAVDVDGDGLAELLFREYSFDQKGFIIYGIGRGAVTKVFEGATSAIH